MFLDGPNKLHVNHENFASNTLMCPSDFVTNGNCRVREKLHTRAKLWQEGQKERDGYVGYVHVGVWGGARAY